MASCKDVITRARRKAGLLGDRRDAEGWDLERGLETLQGLYHAWIAEGRFGQPKDVHANGSYTAGENERIRRNGLAAGTITVPDSFADDATGEQRPPRDLSFVVYADPLAGREVTLLYTAFAGGWTQVSDLTLATEAPLSERGDGLVCCLAEMLAGERGVDLATVRTAALFRANLKNRARPSDEDAYFRDYV